MVSAELERSGRADAAGRRELESPRAGRGDAAGRELDIPRGSGRPLDPSRETTTPPRRRGSARAFEERAA